MTVSSTLNKVVYDGDNTTVAFTYQYQMTDITWMQVYLGEVLQSSGYTVTMQPDGIGGTVTFDTAPAQDVLVTLLRVVPTTQGIDYTPYDAFPADTAEGGYDKLTFIAQQLEENLSRVPTEPIGAPEQPEEGFPHNQTISRDTGDCHPIAAITDLQTELDTLTSGVGDNAAAINVAAPAGSVITFAGASVPSGYLECNGDEVSRTTHADLFAAINILYGAGDGSDTFNVPDLRGEFVRGWDNGKGTDVGRAIATTQADAFESHNHEVRDRANYELTSTSLGTACGVGTLSGNRTELEGGNETRPRNVAMMYCIKV